MPFFCPYIENIMILSIKSKDKKKKTAIKTAICSLTIHSTANVN